MTTDNPPEISEAARETAARLRGCVYYRQEMVAYVDNGVSGAGWPAGFPMVRGPAMQYVARLDEQGAAPIIQQAITTVTTPLTEEIASLTKQLADAKADTPHQDRPFS